MSNNSNPHAAQKTFVCPHTRRTKIARNMCYVCYHAMGKSKKATDCEHKDKPHYSGGMCQTCYLKDYYLKRKAKQLQKQDQKAQKYK